MTIDYAARMQFCENRIQELQSDTEGCDLFTTLSIIWDAEDSGIPFPEWFENSRIAKEIIHATQSNPNRSWNRIHRAGVLDEALMRYDDPDPDY